jgi:outer membrane receptor protein involved in Fe transport
VEGSDGLAVRGVLPADLVVPPGASAVQVSQDGYVPFEQRLLVPANGSVDLEISLAPQTGTLVVQAEERDALIRIEDKAAGFTPAVFDTLAVGPHRVAVEHDGFHPFETRVVVEPRKQTVVQADLEVAEDVAAASRLLESARDAPASVSLVGRREIEAFGHVDLYDALQGVRGVFPSDDLTYKSIGVRGFAPFGQYGNRLQVQLDGHTLNDDWIGSSYVGFDLMTDLDAIDRIELIRGPGSALYGTGALFGVVNLATPGHLRETVLRAGLSSVGPAVLRSHAFGGTSFADGASFWVSAGGLFGQDQDYQSPARTGSPAFADGTARDVGGALAATGMGKLTWRDLVVQFYYHRREKQIPTGSFGTRFGDRRTHSDDGRSFVELRYEPKLTDWLQLLTRVYYDHYDYDGTYPYEDRDVGLAREYYRGDWLGAEVRGLSRFDFGLRLTVGGAYSMHFANPGVGADASGEYFHELHPFQTFSGYLVADYSPVDWLTVSAGGRFDGWLIDRLADVAGGTRDEFLYSINPRAALIAKVTGSDTLKLLVGSAFRAPSIYEMTYWDGGITQVQSPDLEPERIYTGELEYTRRLPAGFWLTASVFLNRIDRLIEQTGEGTEVEPLRYVNLDQAVWTLGGELELRREFRRGWMMALQYSYQRTRYDDPFDQREPPNSPEHLAGGWLIVPLAGKSLRLATRLAVEAGRLDRKGGRTDPAVIWDLGLSGELPTFHLRYSAGLRNLLGWRLEHPVGEDLLDLRVDHTGPSLVLDLTFQY